MHTATVIIITVATLIGGAVLIINYWHRKLLKSVTRTEPLNKWVTMVDWDGPSLVEVTAEINGTYTLRRLGRDNKYVTSDDSEYHGLTGQELFEMSV